MKKTPGKVGKYLKRIISKKPLLVGIFFVAAFSGAYFSIPTAFSLKYNSFSYGDIKTKTDGGKTEDKTLPEVFVATHVKNPEQVKAIYMTACVAATPSWREKLLKLADDTEINSIVIDIKDYTGTISYEPDNAILKKMTAPAAASKT